MGRNPTAWRPEEKGAFRQCVRKIRDADMRIRCEVILHWADGYTVRETAERLGCALSTVTKFRKRFRDEGVAGLADRRGDNGEVKVTDEYVFQLREAVRGHPGQFGYRRPTWTQELLVKVLGEWSGVAIHPSTMSRLLRRVGIRRGMPKPTVSCPWSPRSRKRRIRWIQRLIETLSPNEVAVYEDELDVHLNPKIGPDYMLPGQQKTVLTPGKNVKRYLAGAMNARTQQVVCVEGAKKSSALFVELLKKLDRSYQGQSVIHVILDNYVIHRSQQTRKVLAEWGGRFVLHFLPPYCPDDNKIERSLWREVHANVTRNHRCETMGELMGEIGYYINQYNRRIRRRQTRRRRAA